MRLVTLLCLISLSVNAQISFFDGSYDELKVAAKKEKKVYFIDMYTSWCGYCKKMDATTFRDPVLGDYVADYYLPFKLNAEQQPGKGLAIKHRVTGYPTVLVFNAKGELIDKIVGYKTALEFKKQLEKYQRLSSTKEAGGIDEQDYIAFQRKDFQKMKQTLFDGTIDQFATTRSKAVNMGTSNQRFQFEELKLEVELIHGESKGEELELYYALGKGKQEEITPLLVSQIEKGFVSDDLINFFLLFFALEEKVDLTVLRWVNERVLKDRDNIGLLERKAFFQFKYGDFKDAQETVKKTKKLASSTSRQKRLHMLLQLIEGSM